MVQHLFIFIQYKGYNKNPLWARIIVERIRFSAAFLQAAVTGTGGGGAIGVAAGGTKPDAAGEGASTTVPAVGAPTGGTVGGLGTGLGAGVGTGLTPPRTGAGLGLSFKRRSERTRTVMCGRMTGRSSGTILRF